jgi:UDPglucose 6-dehydrogenase
MRVSVVGTGYLGATHAVCLASWGHTVVGVDVDPERVATLSRGEPPFHEPRFADLLTDGLASGRLSFTTNLAEAVDSADVHFVCVGTPQSAGTNAADLRALHDVMAQIAPRLERPAVVVGRSTVPVGTAAGLLADLRRCAPSGRQVHLAWNPEFLREGRAVEDSLHPDRLVIGVDADQAYETLLEVYAPLVRGGTTVVRTDLATAELAKVSANVMLAARVSLVNLLAEVCERADADIGDLIAILRSDPRIGDRFLEPGVGYGGGCLPKDLRAFVARADELGLGAATRLLTEVDATNLRQRARVVDLAETLAEGVRDRRVAVLGAAFKAGSDDIRDSPALDVALRLHRLGARVHVQDPWAGANVRRAHPQLHVDDDVETACAGADLVLVLTDWDDYRGLDPVSLASVVAQPRIIDGRLVLDPEKWRAAGWRLHALGRAGT